MSYGLFASIAFEDPSVSRNIEMIFEVLSDLLKIFYPLFTTKGFLFLLIKKESDLYIMGFHDFYQFSY